MTKLRLLYRQFGFTYIIQSFLKHLVRPIVRTSAFYIVAVENHKSSALPKSVKLINRETKSSFLKKYLDCPSTFLRQLNSFIDNGSIAIVALYNDEIAGWGFVQNVGVYNFAGFNYTIPPKVSILKNLFIIPKFRGQSIGKLINHARISVVEDNNIPLGFVIPSNKYAIRNLEMYGFVKQIYIKDTLWFNKYHNRRIKILKHGHIATTIEKGLKNEK